ncbi:ciliary microtubule-associated protein 2-like [Centruroides vittatus]|uniref:ciliary microtubule-associated protein 2-like n=1 Tax=Centruroides vittatus TaxID=120091 RepID=UPI00350EE63E
MSCRVEKGFLNAPFGIQSKRFNDLRVHPRLRLKNINKSNLGPGSYEVTENKEKTFHSSWTKALEDEDFSRLPQVFRKDWYLYMKDEPNRRGPGKYLRHDAGYKLKSSSIYGPYTIFGKRFEGPNTFENPGPGAYGNPYEAIENANLKRSMKTKGIMSSETIVKRGEKISKDFKGPGLYEIKSFTNEVLNKLVSVRGPYDLFSGKRDDSSLYGCQMKPSKCALNLSPGVYRYEYFLDKWDDVYRRHNGKFAKAPRFIHKKEVLPGPGHYNVKFPKVKEDILRGDKKIPFLFTAIRPTLFNRMPTRSGPGSYEIKRDPKEKNGCISSFKSPRKFISQNHNLISKHKTMAPCYRHLLQEEC